MRWVTELLQQAFNEADDNWKPLYEDRHEAMVSIKVDSHQLNTSFEHTGRYENITPCKLVVVANQWADNVASFAMGTLKVRQPAGISYAGHGAVPYPKKVLHPGGLCFYFTCNKSNDRWRRYLTHLG